MSNLGPSVIKALVLDSGADLCGIATVDRFSEAPSGFNPKDIYDQCKSVVVFAKKIPHTCLFASNCIPYTIMGQKAIENVNVMTMDIALKLEELNFGCVPIPTDDPYLHWDSHHMYGRAILSLRHAGELAGLGRLGRNTLLINNKLGNMIQLGAVLVDKELTPDPIVDYEVCPKDCQICLNSCPVKALNGKTVNQQLCRPMSMHTTVKGYVVKNCYVCRKVCPHKFGISK